MVVCVAGGRPSVPETQGRARGLRRPRGFWMSRGSCFVVPALEVLNGSRGLCFAPAEIRVLAGGAGSASVWVRVPFPEWGSVSVAKQQPRAVFFEFGVWPVSRLANVNRAPAQVRPRVLSSRSDFLRGSCWDHSRSARRRRWGQRGVRRAVPCASRVRARRSLWTLRRRLGCSGLAGRCVGLVALRDVFRTEAPSADVRVYRPG